ncbi:hypothetical protein [Neoroseomonas lacus]|uniref:Uncharacterized protein n=1 Tax=Neoroseomonas lacus TaxID=287609 RepID=A0A917NT67_9PROT|nr:hypothetical protein [Neoroseomonas lacus]GGJ25304.1 hypothetical protein GCM10011320_35860 [Neoroseomonas lacus]
MPRRRRRASRDEYADTGWRVAVGQSFAAFALPREADLLAVEQETEHVEDHHADHHHAVSPGAAIDHHQSAQRTERTAHRAHRRRVRRGEVRSAAG